MVHNERLTWLDTAKGICILLVVLGHSGSHWYDEIMSWFRMPLFFFLSGILFKPVKTSLFTNFLGYKLVKMLIPYFAYGALITLVFHFHSITEMYLMMQKVMIGGEFLQGPYGVFWFITVLLTTQILMGYISRFNKVTQIMIIIILYFSSHLIALSNLSEIQLPWKLNAIGGALFYYSAGHYLKSYLRDNISNLKTILPLASLFITFTIYYLMFDKSFSINLKTDNFNHIILDGVVPIISCTLICSLSYFIDKIKLFDFLKWLGRNSITIMYLHLPLNILLMNIWKTDYSDIIFLFFGVS
ncbi:hypothetical protein DOS70_08965, partial [Staphylococcus felis]|uniref:acyltransferase family protein n=1 Tax=Staphylococcus felis TaxID=46127 RepID=UPI000E398B14